MTLKAVILDTNEVSENAAPWLLKLNWGCPVSQSNLGVGDAWATDGQSTLVIERKTLNDFCQSIRDGRLFSQASRMVSQSIWSYVIVTEMPIVRSGKVWIDGKLTDWLWTSVQGALLTLQDTGVETVFWPSSGQGYADAIKFLANRDRGPVRARPPKREVIMQSAGEAVLCSLPGISDGRAGAILAHCGTAAIGLQFLTTDCKDGVPGIGPGTKAAVRKALGLPDDLRLAVIDREQEAETK